MRSSPRCLIAAEKSRQMTQLKVVSETLLQSAKFFLVLSSNFPQTLASALTRASYCFECVQVNSYSFFLKLMSWTSCTPGERDYSTNRKKISIEYSKRYQYWFKLHHSRTNSLHLIVNKFSFCFLSTKKTTVTIDLKILKLSPSHTNEDYLHVIENLSFQ